jgi:predicted HicB family RNase H-like nuclease
MNQLRYKGYTGSVCFSEVDGVFHGEVLGIFDSISFEGDSVKSLTEDFHNAIDEYLEFCDDVGKQPQKSDFSIRISPDIYNKATVYATNKGIPINEFVEKIIEANIATA